MRGGVREDRREERDERKGRRWQRGIVGKMTTEGGGRTVGKSVGREGAE